MLGISTLQHPLTLPNGSALLPRAARTRPVIFSRDLYGFIPADVLDQSEPAVLRSIHTIRSGPIAALAGPLSLRLPLPSRVRHALTRLRAYQRVLEEVMQWTPVLPARFGSRLPDRPTTVRLLRKNEDRLERAITTFGHWRQFDIRVSGPRIDPKVGSRTLAAREQIRLELKSLCLAMREQPTLPPGTLLNTTVLIRPFDEPRLDALLARLDGEFGGWLHIDCVGPLPPCNFVRAAISRGRKGAAAAECTLTLTSTLPGRAWSLEMDCDSAANRAA